MGAKTLDYDVVVAGKLTQSGTPSASGDVVTKSYADAQYLVAGVFDVTKYGAIGDGVANDAAAMQAAIDACVAAGGGVVRGRGNHVYDIGVTWPVISGAGTVIFDMEDGLIRYNGASTTCMLEILGKTAKSVVVKNTRFEGSGAASGDMGIRLRNCQTLTVENCRFVNCATSIDLVNDGTATGNPWNEQHVFNNNEIIGGGVGIDMRAVNGGNASFAGCRFHDTTITNTATHFRVQASMSYYGGIIDGWVSFFSAAGTQIGFDIQGGMTSGIFSGRMEETGATSTPQAINVGASGSIAATSWDFGFTNTGFVDPVILNASATVPHVTRFHGSGAGALSGVRYWSGIRLASLDTDLTVTGKITQTGTPTAAGDLATKAYVDAIPTATSVKRIAALTIATANVTLASQNSGTSLNGVALAVGSVFLLTGQTTSAQNGLWVARASGGPLRHPDYDASGDLVPGTQVFATAGSLAGATWVCLSVGTAPWIPDTNTSAWSSMQSSPAYSPGGTDVPVADGGTGRSVTTVNQPVLGGTTATGAMQSMAVGTAGQIMRNGATAVPTWVGFPVEIALSLSAIDADLTTGIKEAWRAPWPFNITAIRASLYVASSSGLVTVDITEAGVSIMTTNKLTIDATEKTSVTAATAVGVTDTAIADDAELIFNVTGAGVGARGLKVVIYGTRLI